MALHTFCHTLTAQDITDLNNNAEVVITDEDFSIFTNKEVCGLVAFAIADGQHVPIADGLKCYINGADDLVIAKGSGALSVAEGDVIHISVCIAGFLTPN